MIPPNDLPHLDADTTHRSVPHLWAKESSIPEILRLRSDAGSFPDLLELGQDDGGLAVALGVEIRENVYALIPTVICLTF